MPECSGLNTQRGGGGTYGVVEDITRSELVPTLHESCDPQQGSGRRQPRTSDGDSAAGFVRRETIVA